MCVLNCKLYIILLGKKSDKLAKLLVEKEQKSNIASDKHKK